jgi:tryptophan-rich sensory protein
MRFTAFLDPESYFPIFRKDSPSEKEGESTEYKDSPKPKGKILEKEKHSSENKKDSPKHHFEGENFPSHQKVLAYENSHLGEGEPNYFEALTSGKFLWRLIFVLALLIISVLICLNVTLDNSVESWYYNLYKPDWAPDGITIVIIYSFLSLLYVWCWYTVAKVAKNSFVDLAFIGFYVLFTLCFIILFKYQNLKGARIIIDIITGYAGLLFIYTAFFLKIGSVSLYLFLFLGWSITMIIYSYQLQDLTKEYSILGLAKKGTSLYKKKVKLELMSGIKIDENGNKVEFNPDDQE